MRSTGRPGGNMLASWGLPGAEAVAERLIRVAFAIAAKVGHDHPDVPVVGGTCGPAKEFTEPRAVVFFEDGSSGRGTWKGAAVRPDFTG